MKSESYSACKPPSDTSEGKPIRLRARGHEWIFPGPTLIMGIVNVSPDSFSGDGISSDVEGLTSHVSSWHASGVDLIDVGAVSTRPGADAVAAEEEWRRLEPALTALRSRTSIPLSVDTKCAWVAERALERGAAIINDVSGLAADPDMANVVARYRAGLVIMHSRGDSKTMQDLTHYTDLVEEVCAELDTSLAAAYKAGIDNDAIVIDPGIGFAKTAVQNVELLGNLAAFRRFGRPVLVGPSRKSFIGSITGSDVSERVFGTAAACALAIHNGANILRVHDIGPMCDVARVSDRIVGCGKR